MNARRMLLWSLIIGSVIPLTPLLCCITDTPVTGRTTFVPRPMATNAARTIGGVPHLRDLCTQDYVYGYTTVTAAYTHSLRASRMGHALFSPNCVTVSGSGVVGRCSYEFLADYFGLSPTFCSDVCFKPHIENGLVIFDSYIGFDPCVPGLYCTIQIPVCFTKWRMDIEEEITTDMVSTPFDPGYMAVGAVPPAITSFTQALTGRVRFGQMQDPYKYGLVTGSHSKSGVADLYAAIGFNPIAHEDGFFGFNVRLTIPTGSRLTGTYLFEPILGNGRHVEIGIGLDGRFRVWEKLGEQELSIRIMGNFMHQCSAQQRRTFDLQCNNFGSRYILLKEFDTAGNYTGSLTPSINHTTLDCRVRADLYTDIVVMGYYTYNNIECDLGYNGFIRSREKIELIGSIPNGRYGFKGVQPVALPVSPYTLINTTENNATLFEHPEGIPNLTPVFISTASIDVSSAASPLIVTHKFFADINYRWCCSDTIEPFMAIGGEIEAEGINTRNTVRYQRTTLSQWGLWMKGGIAFG